MLNQFSKVSPQHCKGFPKEVCPPSAEHPAQIYKSCKGILLSEAINWDHQLALTLAIFQGQGAQTCVYLVLTLTALTALSLSLCFAEFQSISSHFFLKSRDIEILHFLYCGFSLADVSRGPGCDNMQLGRKTHVALLHKISNRHQTSKQKQPEIATEGMEMSCPPNTACNRVVAGNSMKSYGPNYSQRTK